jgi:type III pantothenate kinase
MNLLIDMGNSRLKWGNSNGLNINTGSPIANPEIDRASLAHLWRDIAHPRQIAISCVSTNYLFDLVLSVANELWPEIPVIKAASEAQAFGVKNAYQEPNKLGVDRWLCLTAGYQAYQKPLCIVDCGTAITVDMIDASGNHLGGLISPGLRLMKESLVNSTENLKPTNAGHPPGLATNTDAAIHNGTLSAACGLVDLVLKNHPDNTQLLLTGGDAETIAANLSQPTTIDPKLVLRGLALLLHT